MRRVLKPQKGSADFVLAIFGLIVLITLCCFISRFFVVIPAGHIGVKSLFGKVQKDVYHEGFHLKSPFLTVHKLSIRTQELTMSKIPCLTKEGLVVKVDSTLWYHLDPKSAPAIFKMVGDNYERIIVRPAVRTAIRDVIATYFARDLYSKKRVEVSERILMELTSVLRRRGLIVERFMVRNIQLPVKLVRAIEEKLRAEQEAERMRFILERERREAERKRIEAKGIADAQKIIANSLTKEYLQWYYINTLKELVNSPNNTVIVLPFDQRLVPMLNLLRDQKK